jgi:hypothetical protein
MESMKLSTELSDEKVKCLGIFNMFHRFSLVLGVVKVVL